LYDEDVNNYIRLFLLKGVLGMAKTEISTKKKIKVEDHDTELSGTLASVFLLGFFIIVTWVGVWFLFLDRF
jgi:hypothetical protein